MNFSDCYTKNLDRDRMMLRQRNKWKSKKSTITYGLTIPNDKPRPLAMSKYCINSLENCMVVEDYKTYDETMKEDGMNIRVADTAATCHMGCILIGMTDSRPSATNIRVGNG